MSWFNRYLLAGPVIWSVLAGALSGCGFEPMYAERDRAGPAIAQELAAIDVARIDNPLGAELRTQILGNLAPAGAMASTRYQLAIQLSSSKIPRITEQDSRISRFDFVLTANYSLTDKESGATLDEGSVRSATSYNIVEAADFASLVAEQSAGKQAAREASREIVTRLSLYFDRASVSLRTP